MADADEYIGGELEARDVIGEELGVGRSAWVEKVSQYFCSGVCEDGGAAILMRGSGTSSAAIAMKWGLDAMVFYGEVHSQRSTSLEFAPGLFFAESIFERETFRACRSHLRILAWCNDDVASDENENIEDERSLVFGGFREPN